MKADALKLAAPDFVLLDGDEIHIKVRSGEDEELSSVTFEPGFFAIDVEVWRPTDLTLGSPGVLVFRQVDTGQHYIKAMFRCYLGNEAQEFLVALMRLGSQGVTGDPPAGPAPGPR
jgi:hypothetical protein